MPDIYIPYAAEADALVDDAQYADSGVPADADPDAEDCGLVDTAPDADSGGLVDTAPYAEAGGLVGSDADADDEAG